MAFRRTTKGYRRCDSPGWACRRLIARGEAIREQERGRSRKLRFCSVECQAAFWEPRRGRTCIICGERYAVPKAHMPAAVCPTCETIEGRFRMTREGFALLPSTKPGKPCQWCEEGTALPARIYCSLTCKEALKSFRLSKRLTAAERGAYIGEPGRPLVTSLDACRLHADRTCWKCGAADLARYVDRHEDNTWTCDHVIPIAIGGMHGAFNLAPACWPCNRDRPKDGTDVCHWYCSIRPRNYGREFGSMEAAFGAAVAHG